MSTSSTFVTKQYRLLERVLLAVMATIVVAKIALQLSMPAQATTPHTAVDALHSASSK